MATTKLYLDHRTPKNDGTAHLKIAITKRTKTALIPLNVYLLPHQWNGSSIVNHPNQTYLNLAASLRKADVEKFILQLMTAGEESKLSAQEIKNRFIASELSEDEIPKITFEKRLLSFIANKHPPTRKLYECTLSRMKKFRPKLSTLTFEDIDAKWLYEFDDFLAKTAPSKNARNIHLRNIRAVFNAAIDEGETTSYPFRKFKIRPTATRKRSLSLADLRMLFDYPVEKYAEIYRDMFKLIFMLIGINVVDLHRLKCVTPDGRVEYSRAKTHRLYSIKVEPEAAALIEKYRGKNGLLCIADRWTNHKNFCHQMNNALQVIGATRSGRGGKKQPNGIFPGISTYWARHSWATIAAFLDIPKETIAAALGHGGNTVTDIYIDFDQSKIDDANRRVLDWVLYGKK